MEQTDVVAHALDALEELNVPYCVVGSFAGITFGEPRYTLDVDIVVDLTEDAATKLCGKFPSPDWYVSLPAALQAVRQRRQFNIIHTTTGNKIDVILLGTSEWARVQMSRRTKVSLLPHREGFAAHPEDVILGKLIY